MLHDIIITTFLWSRLLDSKTISSISACKEFKDVIKHKYLYLYNGWAILYD